MVTLPQRSGSQEAIFDKFKESIFSDLHVATIGIVTALDATTGLPTVKPLINERLVQSNGTTTWQEFPEIPDTPYVGSAPSVGDQVLLIFCDYDLSGWLSGYGTDESGNLTPQNQEILRSHSLSNAVAITGLVTASTSAPAITYTAITDATTTDNGTGVSNALLKFVESYEGFSATWYNLGDGTYTIGYGYTSTTQTLPSGWTAPLTEETAESLLNYVLENRYIPSVQSTFSGYTLTQNQFDSMVSFAYNLGSVQSALAKAVKAGTTGTELKDVFELYCHAKINGKVKVLPGLLKRRDAEWRIFVYGDYQV